MRYLFAVLMLTACTQRPIITEPTGVIVAIRDRQGFAACEVVIGETWDHFRGCAGEPLLSLPWKGANLVGRCHFYETNTASLRRGEATPYVAICVALTRLERRSGDMEGERRSSVERVALVVGLRQIPGADLAPLPY